MSTRYGDEDGDPRPQSTIITLVTEKRSPSFRLHFRGSQRAVIVSISGREPLLLHNCEIFLLG
jgi:hypothetical protein